MKGTLFLVPVSLGDCDVRDSIPEGVIEIIRHLRVFIVEEIRTARRFLRKTDPSFPLDDTVFHILNEHTRPDQHLAMLHELMNGSDAGLMSEAGLPGIADPGAAIVALAHDNDIRVRPLPGPSSVLLALISSGLNGQRFTFNGYLPVRGPERQHAIREMETRSLSGEAQIFIETPYRNEKLINDIVSICRGSTRLCIAAGISTDREFISTRPIERWKNDLPDINRIPAVFVLQA